MAQKNVLIALCGCYYDRTAIGGRRLDHAWNNIKKYLASSFDTSAKTSEGKNIKKSIPSLILL